MLDDPLFMDELAAEKREREDAAWRERDPRQRDHEAWRAQYEDIKAREQYHVALCPLGASIGGTTFARCPSRVCRGETAIPYVGEGPAA